ncbi:MAG: phage recombination protein Bet [Sulfobacillus sp.]
MAPAAKGKSKWTTEEIELIKRLNTRPLVKDGKPRAPNDDEMAVFLHLAEQTGLDPLTNQIYLLPKHGRMVPLCGIDGYRQTAVRTHEYAGKDEVVFVGGDEAVGKPPIKATITVYRLVGGLRCPFTASARWHEYNAPTEVWRKMPFLMLAKCAEALAIRSAFPQELSGVYTEDEMAQDGRDSREPIRDVESAKAEVERVTPAMVKSPATSEAPMPVKEPEPAVETPAKRLELVRSEPPKPAAVMAQAQPKTAGGEGISHTQAQILRKKMADRGLDGIWLASVASGVSKPEELTVDQFRTVVNTLQQSA